MPRLRRVDCASPGWCRRRRGRGFTYFDQDNQPLVDRANLERIRGLAIPPAWQEVWICPHPNGHLQAVGIDAAGRRQYLYHPSWRIQRDRQKFDEMLTFARRLPNMRKSIECQLRSDGMSKDRALACAVRLLDLGFFRIGNEQYADENDTHGLATLERRHVKVAPGNTVSFDYVGKADKRQRVRLVDPDIHQIARELKGRREPSKSFLAYKNGRWHPVRSQDINAAIKNLTGSEFSAKHFRTWHATVLAAVALAVSEAVTSKTGRARAAKRAVDEVAHYLGNTPAVCRASYIDPRLFDRYHAGQTIAPALKRARWADNPTSPTTREAVERSVLRLLTS